MSEVLNKILSFIGNLIPTTNIIAFSSFPDYSDNSWAFCKYLAKRGLDKQYRFVWLSNLSDFDKTKEYLRKDGIDSVILYRKSLKGIWAFIRARYVFTTHGLNDFLKLSQHPDKNINFWHGMPIKLLGASEPNGVSCSSNCDYIVASSSLYQNIMAEAFAIPIGKVLVFGQPRCDLLFEKTDWFEAVGIDASKFNKIGMWMPTYIKSIVGDIRVDGKYINGRVSFLVEKDLYELDKHLRGIDTLLLIKIHPMDALQNFEFKNFSNIIIIQPKVFTYQLYPLLGSCDFLLTDYSSVFIDYMILRKPIAFVMDDIESYKNSRGFYFEDISKVLPGPIITNYEDLINFIDFPYCINTSIDYNYYYDNKACERMAGFLGL